MSSGIEEYLDEVDQWKFKVHDRLKGLSARQRQAFWARIGREARKMGLPVTEPAKAAKRPAKRARRTG